MALKISEAHNLHQMNSKYIETKNPKNQVRVSAKVATNGMNNSMNETFCILINKSDIFLSYYEKADYMRLHIQIALSIIPNKLTLYTHRSVFMIFLNKKSSTRLFTRNLELSFALKKQTILHPLSQTTTQSIFKGKQHH